MNITYYYGQDGEIADNKLIDLFDLGTKELRYSDKLGQNLFDITGFVFNNNKILVIFPKHYFDSNSLSIKNESNEYLKDDINILIDVIKQYCSNSKSTVSANSYIGATDIFDSDYPFKQFYNVYDYFQKYGLYKQKQSYIKEGSSGKINWKTVIDKAKKIISNNNLIFMPLYVEKKKHNDFFLTECMTFIIDYTIDYFQDFLSMEQTGTKYHFDFYNNIEYVIKQLKSTKDNLFKDSEIALVKSMIEFFEYFNRNAKGGNIHVRIRYFNIIWQNMIEKYINCHFSEINPDSGAAIFNPSIKKSSVQFSQKSYNDIDNSIHNFGINIDHLALQDNQLYIFDSKYYTNIEDLNYKQYAYNEILRYYYPNITEINNILFLPGEESSCIHFSLSPKYIGERQFGTKIIEQYISPKNVMIDYINR